MKQLLYSHLLEIPAVIAGLINIYLAARLNIWNWLFGIITIILYIVIFFHAKLYANMTMFFIFLSLQFYGWYEWRSGKKKTDSLSVSRANKLDYLKAALAAIILFFSIAYLLRHYTDSNTVNLDAFTTTLGLVAQWMMIKKRLENWLLWIVADSVAIKMYFFKGLYLTVGLYSVFIVLCVSGYVIWSRSLEAHDSGAH